MKIDKDIDSNICNLFLTAIADFQCKKIFYLDNWNNIADI